MMLTGFGLVRGHRVALGGSRGFGCMRCVRALSLGREVVSDTTRIHSIMAVLDETENAWID